MTAARPDPLAGWRAARAARAAAETVATVATAFPTVATPPNPQETADVATVATVSRQNVNECVARDDRDAWRLSEADKAEGITRILGPQARPDTEPAPLDHDAAEQAAMVEHYAEQASDELLPAPRQDALRDGLFRGFHAHRHVWERMPYGAERGAAFADAKTQPGACSPPCPSARRGDPRGNDMAPENARILSMAFANFGSRDDATALLAARAAAGLIAAAGVSPGSLAAMVAAHVTQAQALRERPFSELGPKGTRKRLAELSRRRGVSDEDKASITALRARWDEAERPELTGSEREWLDRLWAAPVPPKSARARPAG